MNYYRLIKIFTKIQKDKKQRNLRHYSCRQNTGCFNLSFMFLFTQISEVVRVLGIVTVQLLHRFKYLQTTHRKLWLVN